MFPIRSIFVLLLFHRSVLYYIVRPKNYTQFTNCYIVKCFVIMGLQYF